MPWRPSTDATIQRDTSSALWEAIGTLYDSTITSESLPRGNLERLTSFYINKRKGDSAHAEEVRAKVPEVSADLSLGPTEIALLDFILHYERGRVLRIVGPRGAGKTSLIHFTELALQTTNLVPTPMMIIIDGLRLSKDAEYPEILSLIHATLREQLSRCSNGLERALQGCVDLLAADLSAAQLQTATKCLSAQLPTDNRAYITIVFDNLDQHTLTVIDRVLELAKQIYLASGLGCILCMRPGLRGYINRQSSARAFFTYRLDIQTPSIEAWLASLPDKLASVAGGSARFPVAHGVTLSMPVLREIFSRFTQLLRHRRSEDDVVQILDAVSANDLRHLARLVRRMLSNRSLPDRWLLKLDDGDLPDFHPLSSLVEASNHLFKGDDDLPNLLSFEDLSGNTEFLLPHRILTLLDGSAYAVPTARLLKWLGELGYEQDAVVACIKLLMTAHLVNSPDAEIIEDESPLPSEFGLTDAGQYYLHHLFHLTDYLALVVADVPLEHKRLRDDEGAGFAGRIHSLVEYLDEVRRREDRQIAALAGRRPSRELRRVADALSRGGLLTASLINGLKDAYTRGVHSRSRDVQAATLELPPILANTSKWLDGAERRLQEVVNRGRRAVHIVNTPLITSDEGMQVQLDLSTLGDELRMSARVRTKEMPDAAMVAVKSTADSSPFSQALLIVRPLEDNPLTEVDDRTILKGAFHEVGSNFDPATSELSVQVISVPKEVNRVALLAADDVGETIRVRLYTAQSGALEFYKLGMVSDAAELRRWSREQLDQLSSQICGGRTIHDRLRIVGTELAQRVLSRTGQKILASLYNTVDSVVIYGSNSEVPWELMCPPPEDEDLLPLLGSMWRTIRWPSDGDVTSLSLALADVQKPAQTMRTVGLGNHDSWRWKTPDDFDGLKGIARLGGTLHLVGRSTTDAFTPLDGSLDLNPQLVRSLGLRGPSSVILSACGEGAAEDLSRLAIAIGLQAGCPVWAPLVMAAQPQIDALDRALAEFVAANPKRSIEDFIADRRAAVPLLSLYACYGVNKPRKKAQYAHA